MPVKGQDEFNVGDLVIHTDDGSLGIVVDKDTQRNKVNWGKQFTLPLYKCLFGDGMLDWIAPLYLKQLNKSK